MSHNKILYRLLDSLKTNSDHFAECIDVKSMASYIDSHFFSWADDFELSTIHNVKQLVKHFLLVDNIPIVELTRRIEASLDNQLDTFTAMTEENEGFDKTHGTKTSILLEQFELPEVISFDRFVNAVRYHPSPVNSVRAALVSLTTLEIDFSGFTFIDIGSGMGRNLLIASEYPFKKIIGIELSNFLSSIAQDNIKLYESSTQKCKNIQLICGNILDFSLVNENSLVLYFWEPFSENIFNKFFNHVLQCLKSDSKVYLVFLGNVFSEIRKSSHFYLRRTFSTNDKKGDFEYFPITIYANFK